jgi:hypothetical protein
MLPETPAPPPRNQLNRNGPGNHPFVYGSLARRAVALETGLRVDFQNRI